MKACAEESGGLYVNEAAAEIEAVGSCNQAHSHVSRRKVQIVHVHVEVRRCASVANV